MVPVAAALLAGVFAATGAPDPTASNRTRPTIARDAHALLTAPDRVVRATSERAQELVEQGISRSRTFAELMAALESTDLIVHLEIRAGLPTDVEGRLQFATAIEHGPRYLRIQIADGRSRVQQIAAIGHELRHALEVADASEVRDRESFSRLYRRIGLPVAPHGYDTRAAQAAGQRVRLELEN
jgi:hypothetical protein